MNPNDLKELREVFRARFDEHDFCIGQEECEKLFRELLSEEEPKEEPRNPNPNSLRASEVGEILERTFYTSVNTLFDGDDIFYKSFKK
jgi:hypothetical protein